MPDRKELIEELQRIHDVLEHPPTTTEINRHSDWSHGPFYHEFDTWAEALREAGIEPKDNQERANLRIPKEDILEEIQRLEQALGRTPSSRDMDNFGKYPRTTSARKFGTWNDALREAGLEPRTDPVGERGWSRESDHYDGPWYEARENAIQRDGEQCVDCGISRKENRDRYGRDLDVHHEVPIDKFDDPDVADLTSNLVTLCPKCHADRENNDD